MEIRQLLQKIYSQKKRILVVGLGISGIESAKFLLRAGFSVVCVERSSERDFYTCSKYRDDLKSLIDQGADIQFGIDGEQVTDFLKDVELCVISPGVSPESAIYGALKYHNKVIVSEFELGIELRGEEAVIVTGSNGKSTTVTLIHAMLEQGGFKATLCGNVGIPVVADLSADDIFEKRASSKEVLVIEASSYQLEACRILKPRVGVFLNLSENHLERHGTLNRYLEVKSRLFLMQDRGDLAVLNLDDVHVKKLWGTVGAQRAGFGLMLSARPDSHGAWISYNPKNGSNFVAVTIDGQQERYETGGIRLLGIHNRYNIAASILAARFMNVDAASVQTAIREFTPLDHRIEILNERKANRASIIINDSKSTTVAASVAAFQAMREEFPERKLTLMIGGLSKAGSWDPLMNALTKERDFLRPVICFGKDGNLLSSHCRAANVPYEAAPNLAQAVELALTRSMPDDVVLLSPGCASFDEFTDFEERGSVFKSLVSCHCRNS